MNIEYTTAEVFEINRRYFLAACNTGLPEAHVSGLYIHRDGEYRADELWEEAEMHIGGKYTSFKRLFGIVLRAAKNGDSEAQDFLECLAEEWADWQED